MFPSCAWPQSRTICSGLSHHGTAGSPRLLFRFIETFQLQHAQGPRPKSAADAGDQHASCDGMRPARVGPRRSPRGRLLDAKRVWSNDVMTPSGRRAEPGSRSEAIGKEGASMRCDASTRRGWLAKASVCPALPRETGRPPPVFSHMPPCGMSWPWHLLWPDRNLVCRSSSRSHCLRACDIVKRTVCVRASHTGRGQDSLNGQAGEDTAALAAACCHPPGSSPEGGRQATRGSFLHHRLPR